MSQACHVASLLLGAAPGAPPTTRWVVLGVRQPSYVAPKRSASCLTSALLGPKNPAGTEHMSFMHAGHPTQLLIGTCKRGFLPVPVMIN